MQDDERLEIWFKLKNEVQKIIADEKESKSEENTINFGRCRVTYAAGRHIRRRIHTIKRNLRDASL